jgi:hypothetical protein
MTTCSIFQLIEPSKGCEKSLWRNRKKTFYLQHFMRFSLGLTSNLELIIRLQNNNVSSKKEPKIGQRNLQA